MKKILVCAAAVMSLCSCSLLDDDDPLKYMPADEESTTDAPEISAEEILKEYEELFGDHRSPVYDDDDFSAYVPAAEGDDVPEVTTEGEVPAATVQAASEGIQLPADCLDVPYISQKKYPSGCELVSSAMLLRYYGFEVEPADLINGGFISYQLLDRDGNDELFGGDPNKIFIGDPFSTHGYGCYSRTIYNGLAGYLDGKHFDTAYLTGTPLDYLCDVYIDFGQPVLIWATSGMEPTDKKTPVTWKIDETGEMFTWIPNEHCMVLVGYDEEFYYFNDPLSGQAVPYGKAVTEERYRELGCQAVTVHPW